MPKESTVTQELVFGIARDYYAENGRPPSISFVLGEVARIKGSPGSTAVVTRLLSDFTEIVKLKMRQRTRDGVDQAIVQQTDSLVDTIMQLAANKATAAFDAERSAFEAERRVWEGTAQELQARLETKEGVLASTQRELQKSNEGRLRLEGQLDGLNRLNTDLQTQVARAEERVFSIQQSKDALQDDCARRLDDLAVRHQEQLASERESWAGERRHLHEQTDAIRQAAKKSETDLQARIKDLSGANEQLHAQLEESGREAGRWRGHAEALQKELETCRVLLSKKARGRGRRVRPQFRD